MYSDEDNELFHSFNWEEGIDRYNELQETLEEARKDMDVISGLIVTDYNKAYDMAIVLTFSRFAHARTFGGIEM